MLKATLTDSPHCEGELLLYPTPYRGLGLSPCEPVSKGFDVDELAKTRVLVSQWISSDQNASIPEGHHHFSVVNKTPRDLNSSGLGRCSSPIH